MADYNPATDNPDSAKADPNDAVRKQLLDQQQLARLKGDQHEVAKIQGQLDAMDIGGAQAFEGSDYQPVAGPQSVADMVNSYQAKSTQDADQNGVTDNFDGGGAGAPTALTPPPADVPSIGAAPKFKNPYVAPDRSGIQSIQELLAADSKGREGSRGKADAASKDAMKGADDSDKFIQDEYKRKRDINEWADVAQRVAHGLAQYGAARQGLNTNTDMSGLKFDNVDYSKKVDQLMDEMKLGLGQNKDKRSMAERRREYDTGLDERTSDRSLAATLSGRSEEMKNREEDAKAQGSGIENENRFNQENYRTKESAAARVEAAKQRQQNASEGKSNREALAEQARQDRLAKEKRDREQHENDKKDKEASKSAATKEKALSDVQSGVELIGDKKTAVKGEAQVASGLSKLGVDKKDQDEVIELSKPNGLFEFGDSKKKKLYEKLKAIQADIESGKRAKAPAEGTQEGTTVAPPPPPAGMIKVKLKATGQTGSIKPEKFDPSTMDKL